MDLKAVVEGFEGLGGWGEARDSQGDPQQP
jgi:hypothetical protein